MMRRIAVSALITVLIVAGVVMRLTAPKPNDRAADPVPTQALELGQAADAVADFPVEFPGQVQATAVEVDGNVAIVALGSKVVFYDISDPSNPVLLGKTKPLGGEIVDLTFKDDAVYAVMISLGDRDALFPGMVDGLPTSVRFIRIIDSSDPTHPVLREDAFVAESALDCSVEGDHLWVAAGDRGLLVYNISRSLEPTDERSIDLGAPVQSVDTTESLIAALTDASPSDFEVISTAIASGEGIPGFQGPRPTAAVDEVVLTMAAEDATGSEENVKLVLISPESAGGGEAATLGSTSLSEPAVSIAVLDSKVYVMFEFGVETFDVSDPSIPRSLSYIATRGVPAGLAYAGNRLYVADHRHGSRDLDAGLQVFDLTSSDPAKSSSIEIEGGARDIEIQGKNLYLAAGGGLYIYDISNPAEPVALAGPEKSRSWAADADQFGSYVYLADRYRGIVVVDMTDPPRPAEVAVIPMETSGRRVPDDPRLVVGSDRLYVTTAGVLAVYDLAAPWAPTLLGSMDLPYGSDPQVANMAVDSGLLLLSTYLQRGIVVDVSESESIKELSQINVYAPVGAAVRKGFAYLSSWDGLFIWNLADASNPQQASYLELHGADQIAFRGDDLFVDHEYAGVVRFLAPAGEPLREFETIEVEGTIASVAARDDLLVVGTAENGLNLFSIPEGGRAKQLAVLGELDYVLDAAFVGDHVLVVFGNGYAVIDVSEPKAPRVVYRKDTAG
jgi:hypothetical protein